VARFSFSRHHKLVEERLDFHFGGQLPPSGWPHNPTTRLWPALTTSESLRCLREEMATGWLWPVCLWRTTNDVSHRRFMSVDKAVIEAALYRWWCCATDQL